MDERSRIILLQGGMLAGLTPDNYEGISYLVGIIWEGALEEEWTCISKQWADSQAVCILAQHSEDDPIEIHVSEVYETEGMLEATGYMTDTIHTPWS